MTPEALARELQATLGSSLRAVVLYGSAASGEHLVGRSDYNVLVIVDRLPLESLRALSGPVGRWSAEGNPPPLVFTADEWRRAADAFPMEYADIRERHRILFGGDPFAGISIDPAHLRLQVEQEARGKLLHLRGGVIAAGERPEALLEILEGTLSKLMILFRGVLRLHGERAAGDQETLTRSTAMLCGFDAEAVLTVLHHVRGTRPVSPAGAAAATAAYLAALSDVVRHLDAFESAGRDIQ